MNTLTVKKCGHCGKMKPATSEFYHRDSKRSSGLQSWCIECVKNYNHGNKTATSSNDGGSTIDTDNEIVELYLMAYLEGYNKSNNKTYGGRTREAREYAVQVCPQAAPLIKAYGDAISNSQRIITNEEKLGLEIVVGIRKLNLKQDFENGIQPATNPNPPRSPSPAENLSIVKTYCNWIERNDFAPQDALLMHFTGASRGAFVNSRRKLAEMGYILEQSDLGWTVTKRPTKEKTLNEMSKEEVIILLKKLIA